jgi:aspartyl-tRNA synthetase
MEQRPDEPAQTVDRAERTMIADLPLRLGSVIRVAGFVKAIRDQKRMQFLILCDRSGAVQVAVDKVGNPALAARATTLAIGSAVGIVGRCLSAPTVKFGAIEIAAEAMVVHSLAEAPLPVAADSALDKQIDWRPVSLRRPEHMLIFAVQTTLERAMRAFWCQEGFIEIHSPKLMGTFSESGAEAFPVRYFDKTAYLAQSPQFYKQMAMAAGFERVFEIGPAFRAEPSFTSRHETEFTSIDMEVAWIESHADIMDMEERWLAHALAAVAATHGNEIKRVFDVEITIPTLPFPRLAFADALAMLEVAGASPPKADDLDSESERRLAALVAAECGHEFLFVTDYPASGRAFYHMRHEDRPALTRGFDLYWKGLEVTTGAQREHRHARLTQQALERGYAMAPLQVYLDFFRYGCPPHGGLGAGLARLLLVMLDRPSIREVTLVSRTPKRLTP